MKNLAFPLALFFSLSGFCQELVWESGVLITKENDVLAGELVYYPTHDAVLFKHNKKVDFFPSRKIQSFRFFDSSADINRQFIVIDKSDFFPTNALLEIVLQGSIKIIRRMKNSVDQLSKANDASDFSYFLLYENKIIPIQKFKSKVLPDLIAAHHVELHEFTKQSKIDLNSATAAFYIIKEYNCLVAKPNLIATLN